MSGVKDCCEIRADIPERQRRVLQVVLWINTGMFLAEFCAGFLAHSTALLADSVDMLGDAIVYGFSLYAVARGGVWQARSALLKGLVMAAFGVAVLVAAGAVALTGSAWPDIVVGLLIAALFGSSAVKVIRGARRELQSSAEPAWRTL
jgi:Co/Zn/Cd efflux system component